MSSDVRTRLLLPIIVFREVLYSCRQSDMSDRGRDSYLFPVLLLAILRSRGTFRTKKYLPGIICMDALLRCCPVFTVFTVSSLEKSRGYVLDPPRPPAVSWAMTLILGLGRPWEELLEVAML